MTQAVRSLFFFLDILEPWFEPTLWHWPAFFFFLARYLDPRLQLTLWHWAYIKLTAYLFAPLFLPVVSVWLKPPPAPLVAVGDAPAHRCYLSVFILPLAVHMYACVSQPSPSDFTDPVSAFRTGNRHRFGHFFSHLHSWILSPGMHLLIQPGWKTTVKLQRNRWVAPY